MLTETQLREEQLRIEQLQQRWMVGSNSPVSLEDLPSDWQPLCQGMAAERLSIIALALASQHQEILYQDHHSTPLRSRSPLPVLSLPVLPERLRPWFRQALESIHKRTQIGHSALMHLLSQRGYVAHPADWLLSESDGDLPDVYLPWQQWVSQTDAAIAEPNTLTIENWDDWFPAPRLQQLKQLRRTDPDAARTLLESCINREPADKRLKLTEVLAIRLTAADSTFLQSLLQDRSGKVSALATQLLVRLGHYPADDQNRSQLTEELASTLELKKAGLIRKRLHLSSKPLNNKTRQAIRTQQLETVILVELAATLDISITQLLDSWQFSQHRSSDNQAFVTNAVNTLADDLLPPLLDNLMSYLAGEPEELWLLRLLVPRLSAPQRHDILQTLIKQKGTGLEFHSCLAFLSEPLTTLNWQTLTSTNAWKTLQESIKTQLTDSRYLDDPLIDRELVALGLMLPAELAAQVLQHLWQTGVQQADPVTDLLKLNAELRTSL
ncbi:DUF5691 domain-containing protein [Gynuella sunshinyii]|uniref:Uncharacterized protein n=1 Tax=Gynuella sunshinyii YC6258 TaxID=1445510 RepID=A0A0C5VSU8_9GAMM|nr:DUF5691 domain-containing protein [Gynuella sunshinyii]AJQ97251.1 hypothetical Protein YC6258_05221 [Gynuella sunshinyii YC6258]